MPCLTTRTRLNLEARSRPQWMQVIAFMLGFEASVVALMAIVAKTV
jgi:hypothetical protein